MIGNGVEGIGEAVSGGLIARAIEPRTGGGQGGDGACLNCGTALIGDYCHRCGQEGHVRRTLTAFWHDLSHGVLHFEGKIWHTLPLLAWRPGDLTRRYIAGERARFVSPIAIFLFSVFLMFAVFHLVGGPITTGGNRPAAAGKTSDAKSPAASRQAELATLEKARAGVIKAGGDTRALDASIAAARKPPNAAAKREASDLDFDNDHFGNIPGWVGEAYRRAKANPALLAYKMQTNAYKFAWALIPISVPFVWLLFLWRRRYKAYDHTVFVTYSIAFMTLLVVAVSLLSTAGMHTAWAVLAILLIPPLHMYRQLRGAYALSGFSALWRTTFLVIFSWVAAVIFLLLLLGIGATG